MNLKKRRTECNSVLDVVLANAGKTASEFFEHLTKDYYIDNLFEASELIKHFIFNDEPITVVGDYDADGITSSAIMTLLIRTLGGNVTVRLPRRFTEGYGLSTKIIDEIDKGLLITVDNGIVATEAIQKAKEKGLMVIVIDHHLGPEDGVLPPADILIDPNALENTATFNSYCGAGLSYKLAETMLGKTHPVMKKLVSLAAIGTIADVMPLIEDNRNIVQEGLASMVTDAGRTTGLEALLNEFCIEKRVTAKDVGFKLGPTLNAPGRLYDDGAMKAYELLSFDGNKSKAIDMAQSLVEINTSRKEQALEGTQKVLNNIRENCLLGDAPITVYEPGLQEGLVGIFAGRIAEEFGVPCIVLTDSENPEIIKGSARSAGGIHLKNLLDAHKDLLLKYGGHAEAAGLSLKKDDLEEFRAAIQEGVVIDKKTNNELLYDLEITNDDIPRMLSEIEKYGPFGEKNPEIVFLIKNVPLLPGPTGYYKTMGNKKQHIKLFSKNADIVAFDLTEQYLKLDEPRFITVVGTLSKSAWHSKITPQIEAVDFDKVNHEVKKTPLANILAEMAKNR